MSHDPQKAPLRVLRHVGIERLIQAACVASLLSSALMVWSVLDPTPFPVIVAMSAGQAIGTIALLSYLTAVVLAPFLRTRTPRAEEPPPAAKP